MHFVSQHLIATDRQFCSKEFCLLGLLYCENCELKYPYKKTFYREINHYNSVVKLNQNWEEIQGVEKNIAFMSKC